MSPPLPVIPLSALESQINVLPNGKARKPPIKLRDCPLKEMVQYKCNVSLKNGDASTAVVVCQPFVRLLRQCENGLTVETTAWEGWKERQDAIKGAT